MSKPSTLESRIATALTATDIKSSNLATLIAETEAAITRPTRLRKKSARKRWTPSPHQMRPRPVRQCRLRSLAVIGCAQCCLGCRTKHKEVKEQEHAAAWSAIMRRSRPGATRRRSSCANVTRRSSRSWSPSWPDIAATDKEVDRINVAAPYGDYPRLRGVELTARGLDRLLQPDISIVARAAAAMLRSRAGHAAHGVSAAGAELGAAGAEHDAA